MTLETFLDSISRDRQPPAGLSRELEALWHTKKGNWEAAHNIAQDIHSPMGSWIHALLHLIEGDLFNAQYWFTKAAQPTVKPAQIDKLWQQITQQLLAQT